MSFAAQFHMPGAYHFDPPSSTPSTLNAGIFRPPLSPSASSYNLARSTGSLCSDDTCANTVPAPPPLSRKRTRDHSRLGRFADSTPNGFRDHSADATPVPEPGSPRMRYTLAGQIETPGALPGSADPRLMEDSMYSDVDYRRALGPKRIPGEIESPSARLAGLRIAGTLQARRLSRSAGWSTFALTTIGGVVGKVWEFCRGGPFRGFHAGGGKGYDMANGAPTPSSADHEPRTWDEKHHLPAVRPDEELPSTPNTPGGFLEPDNAPYMPDPHELSTPESTPPPAAKRRQVSREKDDLGRNWIIVDEPSPQVTSWPKRPSAAAAAAAATPRAQKPGPRQQPQPRYTMPTAASGRKISVPVPRLSHQPSPAHRKPSLRISHAGPPALSSREPASFAPTRSSRPGTPTAATGFSPTRVPMPAQHPAGQSPNPFARAASSPRPSSRQGAPAPSPFRSASTMHRRPSNASAATVTAPTPKARRKTGAGAGNMKDSPRLDAEAKQLASRKLAAERDADARIEAFNARLREMIRQGQEALGTTVEVDMDAGEEGWDDE